MWDNVLVALLETMKIVLLAMFFMVITEFLELKFRNEIKERITRRPINQYIIASLLGVIPGCMDCFFVTSLYVHGIVGFGALTAVMLSTAGDEAFVMLAMVPKSSLLIFTLSIFLGIIGGILADKIVKIVKIDVSKTCGIEIHEEEITFKHFLKEHVYTHILKKHIPKLFFWTLFTMLAVDLLLNTFDLGLVISNLPVIILIVIAALIGIIPESGPHLLFLILYSRGLVPFSVLLVSTLSQDGHGLLPLLSYSVKDTFYVQIFTTSFALIIGIILFLLGI